MIAVVMPTRGLIFTEVEKALEIERKTHELEVFRSSNLKIPDAFNELTEKAIFNEEKFTHIWYIEEDTVPTKDALKLLLALDSDIGFIDYGVSGYSCSARYAKTDEILWCGVGCTLVKREVFDSLSRPWFRSDKSFRLNDYKWIDTPMKYGGHDIWFCCQARKNGFVIKQAEGECRHLKLDALGTPEVNDGKHTISDKLKISKHQIIERRVV